ncbi:hypothetical protein [Schaedlerella arabinosiphila]|uniref:hypothetical protein n=1 Tax=Schaedlerella arabinosiphila TaxID=2044587 RepID=UPI002557D0DF|nr:hypothetical protein [Schaedlerella arabinosiphila]
MGKKESEKLKKYLVLKNSILSLSTFFRIIRGIGEEPLSVVITDWIENILNHEGDSYRDSEKR